MAGKKRKVAWIWDGSMGRAVSTRAGWLMWVTMKLRNDEVEWDASVAALRDTKIGSTKTVRGFESLRKAKNWAIEYADPT